MEIRNHFILFVLTVFIIVAIGGCSGERPPQVTLRITTSSSLPDAQVGEPYSVRFRATSVGLPLNWAGTPPAGLTLYSNSGVISGAPENAGTFNFEITVSNSATANATVAKTFSLLVRQADEAGAVSPAGEPGKLSIITPSPLPNGEKGSPYSAHIQASGGQGTFKWSGTTPANLQLNQETGVISGTPNAEGEFNFDIVVGDLATPQQTATQSFTLTINSSSVCKTHTISMAGFQFNPDTLNIKSCDTVTWTHNQRRVPHTVTSGGFRSPDAGSEFDSRAGSPNARMFGGDSFSHTFDDPGTFDYHCVVHGSTGPGGMNGTIIVNPNP